MPTERERAQIAHVLRRCGFGAAPGEVDSWVDDGPVALVESLLAAATQPVPDETDDASSPPAGVDPRDDQRGYELAEAVREHVLRSMMVGPNRLLERMSWFWHSHFTSSMERAEPMMLWRQHLLVRRHALGHFPTLLRAITTDAAMLLYLDGAGSSASNPNENHARELLELFTLGRNVAYTEEDVRAAARIMAGWNVDWDDGSVSFEPEHAYLRPVTFLGERRRWTLDSFIDHICAQPGCARHVATRLYYHLVGPDLSARRRDELAAVFVEADLELLPLVAAIVRGPDFLDAIQSRARQPIEWLLGARLALGFDTPVDPEQLWQLELLGQALFEPPNVAGWPLDDRWSSAGQLIARTGVMLEWELPEHVYDEVEPKASAVLDRCGVHQPSATTLDALMAIEAEVAEYDGRLELLFMSVLVSPEFSAL